jgi:hypothetical protein
MRKKNSRKSGRIHKRAVRIDSSLWFIDRGREPTHAHASSPGLRYRREIRLSNVFENHSRI